MDAAIFNTMSRVMEWTGNGKPGISYRKETEYGDDGSILGNKIVEHARSSGGKEALAAGLDLVAVVPGKPNAKTFGMLFAKPVIGKQNAVQVIKFIQGTGDKAKTVTATLPKGFKEVSSSGKAKVYSDGKKYISPDLDGHNGGTWKMADKEKNLWKKETRIGTYNEDLSKKVGE